MPGLTSTQGPRTCRGGGPSPQHGRSENLGSAGSGPALEAIEVVDHTIQQEKIPGKKSTTVLSMHIIKLS